MKHFTITILFLVYWCLNGLMAQPLAWGIPHSSCPSGYSGSIDVYIDPNQLETSWQLPFDLEYKNLNTGLVGIDQLDTYSETIENLSPGEYELTVYLSSECDYIFYVTVGDDFQLEFNGLVSIAHPSDCGVADGDIRLISFSTSNGQPPYTFHWEDEDGLPLPSLSDLSSGSYCLIFQDDNDCEGEECFALRAPDEPDVYEVIEPSCLSNPVGIIDLTAVNNSGTGTNEYDFIWSTGQMDLNTYYSILSGLQTGSYSVTITASGGTCSEIFEYFVPELVADNPLEISYTYVNDCPSNPGTGEIDINISGGIEPYIISWSHTSGYIPDPLALRNLSVGEYCISVTDYCMDEVYHCIDLDYSLGFDAQIENACEGDGSIVLDITADNLPFSILWSNGSISSTVTNLDDGTYGVTVTDSEGCQVSKNYEIKSIGGEIIGLTDACNALSDGSAVISIHNPEEQLITMTYEPGDCPNCPPSPIIGNYYESDVTWTLYDLVGDTDYRLKLTVGNCIEYLEFRINEEPEDHRYTGHHGKDGELRICYYDLFCKDNLFKVDAQKRAANTLINNTCTNKFLGLGKNCPSTKFYCDGELIETKRPSPIGMRQWEAHLLTISIYDTYAAHQFYPIGPGSGNEICNRVRVCPNDPLCSAGRFTGEFGGNFQGIREFGEYNGEPCWLVTCGGLLLGDQSYIVCGLNFLPLWIYTYLDANDRPPLFTEDCNRYVIKNFGRVIHFKSELEAYFTGKGVAWQGSELQILIDIYENDERKWCAEVTYCPVNLEAETNIEGVVCEEFDPPCTYPVTNSNGETIQYSVHETCGPAATLIGEFNNYFYITACQVPCPNEEERCCIYEQWVDLIWGNFEAEFGEDSPQYILVSAQPDNTSQSSFIRFSDINYGDSVNLVGGIYIGDNTNYYNAFHENRRYLEKAENLDYFYTESHSTFQISAFVDTIEARCDLMIGEPDSLMVLTLFSSDALEILEYSVQNDDLFISGRATGVLAIGDNTIENEFLFEEYIFMLALNMTSGELSDYAIVLNQSESNIIANYNSLSVLGSEFVLKVNGEEIMEYGGKYLNIMWQDSFYINELDMSIPSGMNIYYVSDSGGIVRHLVCSGSGSLTIGEDEFLLGGEDSLFIYTSTISGGVVNYISLDNIEDCEFVFDEMNGKLAIGMTLDGSMSTSSSQISMVSDNNYDFILFYVNSQGEIRHSRMLGSESNEVLKGIRIERDYVMLAVELDGHNKERNLGNLSFMKLLGGKQSVISYISLDSLNVNVSHSQAVMSSTLLKNSVENARQLNPDIEIFPNPTNGLLNLKVSNCKDVEEVSYTIFDASGVSRLDGTVLACDVLELIDVSTLTSGMYFLVLNLNSSESPVFKRFVYVE